MSTIALYASKVNQMPDLIGNIKTSVSDYITELSTLNSKAANINSGVCDLGDVIASIQSSTQTQEDMKDSLDTFYQNTELFISSVDSVDSTVADTVNQNKDDFYEEYSYLKPDCEKSTGEKIVDAIVDFVLTSVVAYINVQMDVFAWCKEHWKEILLTVVIVIGMVLAIAAVIASGGAALVPILAALLSACGVASGTALTIATVASLVVAGLAIFTTLGSSIMNLMDLWGDFADNKMFQLFRGIMNGANFVFNGLYSVGAIFNSIAGISNSSLRTFAQSMMDKNFATNIGLMDDFPLKFGKDMATFWAGIGEDAATQYAQANGKQTLAQVLGNLRPANNGNWTPPSAVMGFEAAGEATALLSSKVGTSGIGQTWLTVESVLVNINPKVTALTTISNFGTAAETSVTVARTLNPFTFFFGLTNYAQAYYSKEEVKEVVIEVITDD